MKTAFTPHHADALQARYGLRVAARLSSGLDGLPHDISERLRVARQQAVAQRRQPRPARRLRAAAALHASDDRLSLWGWLATGTLAVVLAAGLVTINVVQNDDSATELANLDSALLTDDLPPEAYADPGFVQYLKTGADPSVTVH
jgi:hypothetical protein